MNASRSIELGMWCRVVSEFFEFGVMLKVALLLSVSCVFMLVFFCL